MTARRFRSGVRRGQVKVKVNPARWAATQTRANWATPATGTAQAKASPTSHPIRTAPTMARMKRTLSRTGAAAAATNRPVAFNRPDSKAARDMNRI